MDTEEHKMVSPKKWLPDTDYVQFDSISDFTKFVEANVDESVKSWHALNMPSFSGATYQQAVERGLGAGNPTLGRQVANHLESFDLDSLMTSGISRWDPARVGVMPIVPNAVMGIPDAMLARQTVHEASTHPLTIVFDRTASSGVTVEQMTKYGSVVAALALTLQRVRPVEVYACSASGAEGYNTKRGGKFHTAVSMVRMGSSPFDPAQIAFGLADPAMYRCLMFANRFRHDIREHSIPWGWQLYDKPVEREARLRYLINPQGDFLFIGGMRLADIEPIMRNPRAWIEKQLRVFAPQMFIDE